MPRREVRVDLARLPPELVALVEALDEDDQLTLTRDGRPVAAVRRTEADAASPSSRTIDDGNDPDVGVTVVATSMKLSTSARARLSTNLGSRYVVVDIRAAPPTTDVLLVPSTSPQLIGALRAEFPNARVVVAEIDDDELGVRYSGPVQRLISAGVDAYLSASTLQQAAAGLDRALTQGPAIGPASPRPRAIASRTPDDPPSSAWAYEVGGPDTPSEGGTGDRSCTPREEDGES